MQVRQQHKRLAIFAGGGLAICAVAILGVAASDDRPGAGPGFNRFEPPNLDLSVPNRGLADWVSYGDQVSVVLVVREEQIEPPREVWERKEGYIGRTVTLRIERTLWIAPGVAAATGEIELTHWGWFLKGDDKRPSTLQMQVGGRYLAPLARMTDGWAVTSGIGIPIEGDTITRELETARSWLNQLSGLPLDELERRLAATAPDPRADELRPLPADQRARAIAGGQGVAFPGP